jgi:hypothetical protein
MFVLLVEHDPVFLITFVPFPFPNGLLTIVCFGAMSAVSVDGSVGQMGDYAMRVLSSY